MNKNTFRITLIAAGLLSAVAANAAADTPPVTPTPVSDSASASDSSITAAVKKGLKTDQLKHSHVKVSTMNGVVTLTGHTKTDEERGQAETVAKATDGVKSVDNQIVVKGHSSETAKTEHVADDSWITTKVKSDLLANSITKGFDVKVVTLHGVVTLTGQLPSQASITEANNIAAKVKGVQSVDGSGLSVKGEAK